MFQAIYELWILDDIAGTTFVVNEILLVSEDQIVMVFQDADTDPDTPLLPHAVLVESDDRVDHVQVATTLTIDATGHDPVLPVVHDRAVGNIQGASIPSLMDSVLLVVGNEAIVDDRTSIAANSRAA